MLWHPGQLESKDVEDYLSKSQEAVQTGGVGSLPLGAHVRDDEQALYLLLQFDNQVWEIPELIMYNMPGYYSLLRRHHCLTLVAACVASVII